MTTAQLLDPDQAWAVVDVETSGLHPGSGRVLSVAAMALDAAGRPAGPRFASLVNAGGDPGPVHVHGLTRARLAAAPRFDEIAPDLLEVLDGRILVAHNAAFDHGFLAAEAERAGLKLPVRQRLCTLALSRRLGIDVPNHKLATLAGYWGVPQRRAHDAEDDTQVLSRVLTHSLLLAAQLGMPLPLIGCDGRTGATRYPPRVTTPPCPWRYPGRLAVGRPLVQGMKVAVTGTTGEPRVTLVERLTAAGLDVQNSVSRLTSALICNEPGLGTRKAERAREEGIVVLDEATVLRLLDDVRPGEPQAARPAPRRPRTPRVVTRGPLYGRRVLVLGGTHPQAAAVRTEVTALGGAAAVNLSAGVTDVILMAGGETDRRLTRIREAELPLHRGQVALGITVPAPCPEAVEPGYVGRHRCEAAGAGVPVLPRGAVIDLPDEGVWTVNVAWRADALADGTDVDVVALLVDADEQVIADEDFVFYNAPVSEHGAVVLAADGDSEQSIRIDLDLVSDQHSKIVIAAALSGDATFGDLGAVTLSVDGDAATAATSTLDAATTEATLLLAEIYRREGTWRLRAIGQGNDDGLAELATRHGVAVEGA
ncbi:TerD family protein [Pseudonocardia sp. MH-G8]|uniref:TerD family protein n=1 Tax=Pseudonocardia sp. MH-G8 TaxID=1854588 RepID=UPI001E2C0BCB|nr:TerD family protein [Pseudonocardia sp. MH-G8]